MSELEVGRLEPDLISNFVLGRDWSPGFSHMIDRVDGRKSLFNHCFKSPFRCLIGGFPCSCGDQLRFVPQKNLIGR